MQETQLKVFIDKNCGGVKPLLIKQILLVVLFISGRQRVLCHALSFQMKPIMRKTYLSYQDFQQKKLKRCSNLNHNPNQRKPNHDN